MFNELEKLNYQVRKLNIFTVVDFPGLKVL